MSDKADEFLNYEISLDEYLQREEGTHTEKFSDHLNADQLLELQDALELVFVQQTSPDNEQGLQVQSVGGALIEAVEFQNVSGFIDHPEGRPFLRTEATFSLEEALDENITISPPRNSSQKLTDDTGKALRMLSNLASKEKIDELEAWVREIARGYLSHFGGEEEFVSEVPFS